MSIVYDTKYAKYFECYSTLYYRKLTEDCFKRIGQCALAIAETYKFANDETADLPLLDIQKLSQAIERYKTGLMEIAEADNELFYLAKRYIDKAYTDGETEE